MFNIGGGEMLVIFLLALLVLGPERLPKAMGQVGRAVAQMRKLSSGFQDEIRRAMDPMDAPFRPGEQTLSGPVPSVTDEVRVVSAGTDEPAPTAAPTDPPAPVEPATEPEDRLTPDGPSDLLVKPPVADHPDDPAAPIAVEPETDALVVEPDPAPRGTVTPLRPRLDEGDGGDRATG
ncbi:twin-arginine translocase subunit TatB [Iamia sp. SCSIO 61187]|uniref:Sec-independent protein translocase protein TatB n=1 Tax=Iamia sp. SCSIO 61187 TaxID=2722752 RepID=UPI001C6361E4|nr:Sec-independent protein translocase protein TatB [Iamia sp. SCSIO 61187]QYG92917.1 twin-arginine translocase subunit TatB [Iamia sp. SCSIO 61187]